MGKSLRFKGRGAPALVCKEQERNKQDEDNRQTRKHERKKIFFAKKAFFLSKCLSFQEKAVYLQS